MTWQDYIRLIMNPAVEYQLRKHPEEARKYVEMGILTQQELDDFLKPPAGKPSASKVAP